MPRKLNTHVNVDGTWYGPDDDVPAEVAKQIDNPNVWADGSSDSEESGELERPAGNASRDTWAAYAESQDVTVTDEMKRDDIVAAVDSEE